MPLYYHVQVLFQESAKNGLCVLRARVFVRTNDLLFNDVLPHSTVCFVIICVCIRNEAMEISKSVLIDHKLILLSNDFTLVLSTELAVTPDCVIY